MPQFPPNPGTDPKSMLVSAARLLENGEVNSCVDLCLMLLKRSIPAAAKAEASLIAGVACQRVGRQQESIGFLNRCLELSPEHPYALNTLGIVSQEQLLVQAALGYYERGVAASPEFVECWYNLAGVRRMLGMHGAAREAFLRVLALKPDMEQARAMLLDVALAMADWSDWEPLTSELLAAIRRGVILPPFTAFLLPEAGMEDAGRCALRWARKEFAHIPQSLKRASGEGWNGYGSERKLHIGYLSADFHDHATAYLLARVLELHDHSKFAVSLYSYGPNDGSPMRRRMEALPGFVELYSMPSQAAVARIARDHVDILVDLKGYTTASRLDIVAARPAPVQVGWLGWPGTTGIGALDYMIVDETVCPPEDWAFYSEIPYLMPGCYQPTDDTRPLLPPVPRSELGLPEDGFVLAALHQTYKINPPIFDAWCAILRENPVTHLWLLEPRDSKARENLTAEARSRGIPEGRICFAPRVGQDDHLARLRSADLWLDTWPYGSHTTSSDALWAGLPVLALTGKTFPSRVSGSVLNVAGLEECITSSPDEFVRLAGRLIADADAMETLRGQVAAARQGPLFDSQAFVRKLEHAFTTIWDDAHSRKG